MPCLPFWLLFVTEKDVSGLQVEMHCNFVPWFFKGLSHQMQYFHGERKATLASPSCVSLVFLQGDVERSLMVHATAKGHGIA